MGKERGILYTYVSIFYFSQVSFIRDNFLYFKFHFINPPRSGTPKQINSDEFRLIRIAEEILHHLQLLVNARTESELNTISKLVNRTENNNAP